MHSRMFAALALVVCSLMLTGMPKSTAAEEASKAAPATAAEPDAPVGCPHAGDGPCCTTCREKLQDAASPKNETAPAKKECPCQRARRLREGG